MITPSQSAAYAEHESTHPSSPVRQFEHRIDEAIKRAEVDGRWPCTISLVGVSDGIRRMFEREYGKAGWRARIVYDWRDGDYLEISKP